MKQRQSIPLPEVQTHPAPQSSPVLNSSSTEMETDDEDAGWNDGRQRQHQSPTSSTAQTPTTSSSTTINLSREYTLAMQTNSYNEIWAKIHPGDGSESVESSPARLVARVLRPDRASIQEALGAAPSTHITRLVSHYFESSESTSALCLSLHRAVDRTRKIYAPITTFLDLLPSISTSLSPSSPRPLLTQDQCDLAFDTLLEFDRFDNPFPTSSAGFQGMRQCFSELRQQLESCLGKARRRYRLLRRGTRGAGACLIGAATGAAVAGLALATHALAAMVTAAFMCLPTGDVLAGPRRRAREHMAQLDAAARGTYVLDHYLDTIERLVARLHETVESDKKLVSLGLDGGRGQRHPIEEVVRLLRKNHPSFLLQLRDLDEHICFFFATVNSARSQLLQQIHQHRQHSTSVATGS